VAELEGNLAVLLERLQQEGQRIPNMTHPSVPIGSEDVASLRKEVLIILIPGSCMLQHKRF
jgi:seryl-tRNA synthetase